MQQNRVKSIVHAAILLIPIILSSGCSSILKQEEPQTVTVIEVNSQKPKLNLPPTTPINTLPINWKVITEDNISDVFSQISETNDAVVIYGLDQTNYENLSINMASILRLLQEQNSHINAYKNYYEKN